MILLVKAPSTLGTFLRSGGATSDNCNQPRALEPWSAGAGPGRAILHRGFDYLRDNGLAKELATTATRARGAITRCWPWPLAPATSWLPVARGPTPLGVPPTS